MLDEILAIVDLNHPGTAAKLLPRAGDRTFTGGIKGLHAGQFESFPQTVEGTNRDGGAGEGPGKHEMKSDKYQSRDV